MCNPIKEKIVKINEFSKAQANCAVVGIYGHPQAALMTYYMLHSLQHRGQEATGITTFFQNEKNGELDYATHRKNGLVIETFEHPELFTDLLKGNMAVGHNRYATTGAANDLNIQPLNMKYHSGILSVSHNGNLVNTNTLRKKLEEKGAIFHTTTDTELFMHLIAHSKKTTVIEQIKEALNITKGAYSLAILTKDGLIAARDPYGVRPLSLGRIKISDEFTETNLNSTEINEQWANSNKKSSNSNLNNDKFNEKHKKFDEKDEKNTKIKNKYAYVIASETCAFDMIGAEEIRTINHNEMIIINEKTLETGEIQSYKIQEETPIAKHCIFEYIYFSRPDSRIFGHNVDKIRRKLGKNLAEEYPIASSNEKKTTVIAVPDSGNTAALGYARANQKQGHDTAYEIGLIRSHYVGRTFIQAGQDNREFKVKSKFNTVNGVIENRNIVVVDDSIVRGTTSKALIKLIRNANPENLHLRITSPPITSPCHYGMNFPHRNELIANEYHSEEEIAKALGVDTLHYLSAEKLLESMPQDLGIDYCTACFTGEYPIDLEEGLER